MKLIIDQGNTRTKLALFEGEQLVDQHAISDLNAKLLTNWLEGRQVEKAIISSVVGGQLYGELNSAFSFPILRLHHELDLPITLKYRTPETLGLDRIALVAGAQAIYPGKACLVMDAGSCITYDFISANGEYLGGAIAPGVAMRFKAMNEFTAGLPLASPEDLADHIGGTTLESLSSGVMHGVWHELQGTINQYESRFPDLITLLTGGDLKLFDGFLKNTIFAAPELLLQGLNHILDYHAEMR